MPTFGCKLPRSEYGSFSLPRSVATAGVAEGKSREGRFRINMKRAVKWDIIDDGVVKKYTLYCLGSVIQYSIIRFSVYRGGLDKHKHLVYYIYIRANREEEGQKASEVRVNPVRRVRILNMKSFNET